MIQRLWLFEVDGEYVAGRRYQDAILAWKLHHRAEGEPHRVTELGPVMLADALRHLQDEATDRSSSAPEEGGEPPIKHVGGW